MYPSPENQISFIDNLNDNDCLLNDTNSLSSFFSLKQILEMTSLTPSYTIVYHPRITNVFIRRRHRHRKVHFYSTSFSSKNHRALATSVSMNILLKDIISTGLGDK